jgi:hypothetical protein
MTNVSPPSILAQIERLLVVTGVSLVGRCATQRLTFASAPQREWRSLMDFIERWFGVWPDGGNGSLEYLLIVGAVIAVGTFAFKQNLNMFLLATGRRTRATRAPADAHSTR